MYLWQIPLIAVSIVPLVAIAILFMWALCVTARGEQGGAAASDAVVVEVGLDEAALKALPKAVVYGEDEEMASTCCAVCLGEYSGGDVLRRLPGCTHAFHRHCVDQWLRLHATCPLCRTSPSPALSTLISQNSY